MYRKYRKDYSWNPSTCICQNGKYLKSITDTSVTVCVCDEIINGTDSVSRNMTNTLLTEKTRQMLYQQMSRVLCQ